MCSKKLHAYAKCPCHHAASGLVIPRGIWVTASLCICEATNAFDVEHLPRAHILSLWHAEGKLFAVWRPLLISEQDSRSTPDVELLQRLVALTDSARCWAIILSKGGHFSAAVYDLRPVPPLQHSRANAPLFKELAHKSYHRYVVRWAEPCLAMQFCTL